MRIGNIAIPNNLLMAPMAGITDATFRALVASHGAGLTFSEMVSAKSLVYGNKNTFRLLENENIRPWAVQFFGHEPRILADAIARLDAEAGDGGFPYDIVNINMGCPMPKIVNNGDGAALMKNPLLVGQLVEAAVGASPRPVTVKIRLGFTPATKNAVEIARVAQESGAALVIVHGRTRDQYYAGEAHWDEISAVKAAIKIPVIGNGDIFVPEDAIKRLHSSGCDGIMVARGAMGNPWIFSRTVAYLETGELPPPPGKAEIVATAIGHLHAVARRKGRIEEMRKHLSSYTKGMPGSAQARQHINLAKTAQEMETLLRELI
ncbi:MAG: tRNA dihydrouridine synthase DusB [Defluviitaleaceae bacterium]|nr:tRNA dihydrouridine synthase DusB [Defluviitaleaceae bacterium]MCL2239352.1 tRNA dihydrouridine synthase DusB [Defluviitaleaceae bacterium]